MKKIYELLPAGENNKISAAELQRITGARDIRALRAAIRAERLQGALILSTRRNGGGYFKPATISDLKTFYKENEAAARATFAALKAARKAIKEYDREQDGQDGLVLEP